VTQLTQGGTQATFDNTGSLTVGSGRTLSVSGGAFTTGTLGGTGTVSFNGTSATFNKPFSLPVLNVTGGALSFTGSQTTAGITMNLVSTTVSSAGFTNSVGQTLNARSVNFNTILINQGLLVTDGSTSVTGPNSFFSNAAGSTLLIQATGATGNSTFSAPSFTNAGSINMTTVTSSYTDVLTVGGGTGTLTNSAGAFITILPGTGGTRTINGLVNNQGDVTVRPGPSPAGTLQINGGLTHTGALNLEIGGLTASTGYSRVSVSGTATLRGTLNYALVNGYTPTKGDPFDILTATSVAGQFTIGTQPGGWANPLYLPIGAPTTLVRLTAP
jgi:fibronectin-binding autotransporter adhesin